MTGEDGSDTTKVASSFFCPFFKKLILTVPAAGRAQAVPAAPQSFTF